jgi:uncharacterized protein (TIGR00369 family)
VPSCAIRARRIEKASRAAARSAPLDARFATFADVTSASALWNAYESGSEIPVTTDMHVRYCRQPLTGPLMAEATVIHRGRRLLGTECVVTDAEQRVLVRSTATYMIVPLSG